MNTAIRPMRRSRRIPVTVRIVMTLAASLGVLVVGSVIYVAVSERSAGRKALAFCTKVKVGDSSAKLMDRATAAGASAKQSRWVPLDSGEQELLAIFEGATSQSRHVCTVQAKEDVVTRVDYSHPD